MKTKSFFCIFLLCLVMPGHVLFAEAAQQLKADLTAMRIALYRGEAQIRDQKLELVYDKIQQLKTKNDRILLTAYWGILCTEIYLYSGMQVLQEKKDQLVQIYKTHKSSTTRASLEALQKTGDFAFLMMRLFPKQKLAYLMDMRMFFLKSLIKDRNDISSRVGLGKWWAYRVIASNHRELNHSIAQAEKYLSNDYLLALGKDKADYWVRIDAFNAYRIRSAMRMKCLYTNESFQDMKRAQKVLPEYPVRMAVQKFASEDLLSWF